LAWTLPICVAVAVGGAASVAAGWFGPSHENSPPPERSRPTDTASFYVDAARGRDSNPGTSTGAPWRTLSPLARISVRGGDSILLRGGESFAGSIRLSSGNLSATSRTAMLTIGSYGGGRATVLAPSHQDAISAVNVAGIRVSGVDLVG